AFGWGEGQPGPGPEPVVTASECARHFGMDPDRWRKVCNYAASFYYHAAVIRFDPSVRRTNEARYSQASRRIQAGIAPEDVGMPGVGTRRVGARAVGDDTDRSGPGGHSDLSGWDRVSISARDPRRPDGSNMSHHGIELLGAQEQPVGVPG